MQTNNERNTVLTSFIKEKHKGMHVRLKAILEQPTLFHSLNGKIVQINKGVDIKVTKVKKNSVILARGDAIVELPTSSKRISQFYIV